MQYVYEPFILRRLADDRIFFVNAKMPFNFFMECFQTERPFFLVSQLDDGRLAIIPNASVLPWYQLQAGFGTQDLLPTEFEYVTMKDGVYPVIITAHPVARFDEWLKKFEMKVSPFARQTLSEFIAISHNYVPVQFFEEGTFPTKKKAYTETVVS